MNNKSIEERIAEGVRKGIEEAKKVEMNEKRVEMEEKRRLATTKALAPFMVVAIVAGSVFVSLFISATAEHFLGWNFHILMPIFTFVTIGYSLFLYTKKEIKQAKEEHNMGALLLYTGIILLSAYGVSSLFTS